MAEGRENLNFTFDRFRLDGEKLMLYRDGAEVAIAPKVVKTLAVLIERAGTIIAKDDLISSVWGDSIVEESNLSQYLYLLRKTLGQMPDGRPYIETLRRRGYRFNGDVRREEWVRPKPQPSSVAFQGTSTTVRREGNVLRLVEPLSAEAALPAKVEKPVRRRPSPRTIISAGLLVMVAGMLAAAGIGTFGPTPAAESRPAEFATEISITRLTSVPDAVGATISPDGNFFVYAEVEGDSSALFLQQTGQSSRKEIASLPEHKIIAATITPDQRWVYFSAVRLETKSTVLYRTPSMGGPLAAIAENVNGVVSFSPTGSEMVFSRRNGDTTYLVVADTEGGSQRAILERSEPVRLSDSPTWSPDGKLIAFGEVTAPGPGGARLSVLDLTTGQVEYLSDEKLDAIYRANWMPDGSGIVIVGTRAHESYSTFRDQVYLVSYPEGRSRRLTNEGNRHNDSSLGVTNGGQMLVIAGNRMSQIWSMDAGGRAVTAQQVSKGIADGRSGLVPLQDGRLAFLTRIADRIAIQVSDENGNDLNEVPTKLQYFEELRADAKGEILVFSATAGKTNHLYRIDADGSGVKQLTFGDSHVIDASVSPDGKTIVYGTEYWIDGKTYARLERISQEGERDTFSVPNCWMPNFSPDGSLISCIRYDKPELVVIAADDGRELEHNQIPKNAVSNWGAGWTPDGKSLVLVTNEKGVSNLTAIPRDGRKPYALTDFTSGQIYRFAYSHDGTRLYLARGYPIRDAILISGIK